MKATAMRISMIKGKIQEGKKIDILVVHNVRHNRLHRDRPLHLHSGLSHSASAPSVVARRNDQSDNSDDSRSTNQNQESRPGSSRGKNSNQRNQKCKIERIRIEGIKIEH